MRYCYFFSKGVNVSCSGIVGTKYWLALIVMEDEDRCTHHQYMRLGLGVVSYVKWIHYTQADHHAIRYVLFKRIFDKLALTIS